MLLQKPMVLNGQPPEEKKKSMLVIFAVPALIALYMVMSSAETKSRKKSR